MTTQKLRFVTMALVIMHADELHPRRVKLSRLWYNVYVAGDEYLQTQSTI